MKVKIFRCEDCDALMVLQPKETRARCPQCKKIVTKTIDSERIIDYMMTAEFNGVVNCKVR